MAVDVTTAISRTFADVRSAGRMAFMPFVTAGDPDLATTQAVVRELARREVDLIEVGFPYSDPIADGPVIQASYTRALNNRITVDAIFTAFEELRDERLPPRVAMVSYAIVYRHGVERFLDRARQAGFAGLIVPDLPGDEAGELASLVRQRQLDLIELIAPTTSKERARRVVGTCSGFLYCVAVAGTTGEREQVADVLLEQLKWLRGETELPLAVGFGISRPQHVEPLRTLADGIIVGSALVRRMEALHENDADRDAILADIGRFAEEMVAACRGPVAG